MNRIPLIALLLVACGNKDAPSSADAAPDCSTDPRAQVFTPGMRAIADDGVQVVLLSADPAPPVRFDNIWALQVLDDKDVPMADVTLRVEPFMPDHGHGTPKPPSPVASADIGGFDMGPFDLWMPGIWELRIAALHTTLQSNVVFTFCIEE